MRAERCPITIKGDKMRKLFFGILAMLLALGMVGCGNTTKDFEISKGDLGGIAIVYVTESGECYHTSTCQYLSKSCIEIDLEKAVDEGYRCCSRCDPPTAN